MDLVLQDEIVRRMEEVWPNHGTILSKWLPQSKILLIMHDDPQLANTLIPRLPAVWAEANIVDLKEWYNLADDAKQQYVDKYLILTTDHPVNYDIPRLLLFLPIGVICEQNGKIADLRDHSGFVWGDMVRFITSAAVLNGEAKL